jgi:hypothetical protein
LSIVGEMEKSQTEIGQEVNYRSGDEVKEEISVEGLRVDSSGVIDTSAEKPKHYPMSNKNRTLVAEYEKEHGPQQQAGESYRQMFNRVVGLVTNENGNKENVVREMLSV